MTTETRLSNITDSITSFLREFSEFKTENNLEIDSIRVLTEINKILRGKKFDSWSTWISRVGSGVEIKVETSKFIKSLGMLSTSEIGTVNLKF